ncbi:MAG: hypothetical protein Q9160_008918 [Pyrenula sp. 1 TL-2023]
MSSLFCCSEIQPYRNQTLSHEDKFRTFMQWAKFPREGSAQSSESPENVVTELGNTFAVQLVQQVNYGPIEHKRYFVADRDGSAVEPFSQVGERQLIDANFSKLNTYKNFKCTAHNKFFEVNIYQKDPVNKHHWRANVARPASEIDL